MCGIAGFLGDFDEALLDRMNRIQAHRGPDAGAVLHFPQRRVGLAHRRLSIIDLSPLGHQPMWDKTGTVLICYNGELYNYLELRRELIEQGYEFRSRSDTETLLNLYLRDGRDMLAKLNGMFAFAIYDKRDTSLFIARDGLGVKPLYYTQTPKGFLFASELKALLQSPDVDRSLDHDAVHDHLTYLWCPAPRTMLRAVKKLEPGCALSVRAEGVTHWRFYDLPVRARTEPMDAAGAAAELRERLETAVRRQLVSDVPVGAFLSGGLDSSAVVAMARKIQPDQRLNCFTIGFKDATFRSEGMVDDLPYAERVAKRLGVDLHTVWVGAEMAHELEGMVQILDEPQADPAPLNALFISRLARKHGIKVLLSGAGGDDIFTGYRRHRALMTERYWSWMSPAARGALARGAEAATLVSGASNMGRRFAKAFRHAGLDADERLAGYFHWVDRAELLSLYSPRLRHLAAHRGFSDPLVERLRALPPGVHPLNRMLYLECRHFLADHNLNYTDKVAMAAGVEVRVPLLDPDLVDFAYRLPVHLKQRGAEGKWIFRRAMEGMLPPEVIHRPKTGFGAPLRYWLRYELKPLVEAVLNEDSLKRRGLFDPRGVKDFIKRDLAGRVDGAYTLFSLVCIELWCRHFIDRVPEPLY